MVIEDAPKSPSVIDTFLQHVQSVEKLMNFDRDVLDFAIQGIVELKERLEHHHRLDNPQLTAARTLEILRGYRTNDSLRNRYETIFNQALVLLVSYFGSSVHDLFRQGIASALVRDEDSALLREQVKISFRELREAGFDLKDIAPDLLVQAKDISFQDMQSIARAFKDYLGITIERDSTVNEIVIAQACRHVIVHTGGTVDERLIRQAASAYPRTLKPLLQVTEQIQFSVEEVSAIAKFMVLYLESLAQKLDAKKSSEKSAI